MTSGELHELLQKTYFDNIDNSEPEKAALAFTDDVAWSHYQVWEHHGHLRNRADNYRGRDQVRDFLAGRVGEMREEGIRHRVKHVIVQGSQGAFRAEVIGVTGESNRFFGWVELEAGRISRYIVGPEP